MMTGSSMTTPIPATLFADPAPAQRLEQAATALTAHGFTVEILDDAAARTRIKDLIPGGASVFTAASETLPHHGMWARASQILMTAIMMSSGAVTVRARW